MVALSVALLPQGSVNEAVWLLALARHVAEGGSAWQPPATMKQLMDAGDSLLTAVARLAPWVHLRCASIAACVGLASGGAAGTLCDGSWSAAAVSALATAAVAWIPTRAVLRSAVSGGSPRLGQVLSPPGAVFGPDGWTTVPGTLSK